MNLIDLIIKWTSSHSGADYFYELDPILYLCDDLEVAHQEAVRRVEFREKVDPGAVRRRVAEFKEGTWQYSIGWGGTKVSLSPNSATISSYYMNPHGSIEIKGSAYIRFTPAKDYEDLDKVYIEWTIYDDLEHSWGRLNSLYTDFKSNHNIALTTEVPDVIKNFKWDEGVGGGW